MNEPKWQKRSKKGIFTEHLLNANHYVRYSYSLVYLLNLKKKTQVKY
jgi:hypothetical protein